MILIFPFARPLQPHRMGEEFPKINPSGIHPKNYPYWKELIALIDEPIIQVGEAGEEKLVEDFRMSPSLKELADLIRCCRTWIGVDSFGQHYAWALKKKGIALFGCSNPAVFGHVENINLYADEKYFRGGKEHPDQQFWWWEQIPYNPEAFVKPEVVIEALKSL